MKFLVLAAFLIPLSAAHLCLFNPPQRGSMMGVDKPGADDCNLEKPAPCGGRDTPGNPGGIMWPGMPSTVTFQKNLDHFNMGSPGNFEVSVQVGSSWTKLNTVPDSNTTSLYVYSMMVDVPGNLPEGKTVLQVVYNTNNPQAPANFYQCADVVVMKPSSNTIKGRPLKGRHH